MLEKIYVNRGFIKKKIKGNNKTKKKKNVCSYSTYILLIKKYLFFF